MSSDKTHISLSYIFLFLILVIFFYFVNLGMIPYLMIRMPSLDDSNLWINTMIFIISYIIGTYFLSPDLDTYSKPYSRSWPVSPTVKAVSGGHRKTLHTPFIGAIVIELVLICLIAILLFLLKIVNNERIDINDLYIVMTDLYNLLFVQYLWQFIAFTLGLMMSNLVHELIDAVS